MARSAVDSLRNIPGLEVFTPDDFNDLPPDQQQVNKKKTKTHVSLKHNKIVCCKVLMLITHRIRNIEVAAWERSEMAIHSICRENGVDGVCVL